MLHGVNEVTHTEAITLMLFLTSGQFTIREILLIVYFCNWKNRILNFQLLDSFWSRILGNLALAWGSYWDFNIMLIWLLYLYLSRMGNPPPPNQKKSPTCDWKVTIKWMMHFALYPVATYFCALKCYSFLYFDLLFSSLVVVISLGCLWDLWLILLVPQLVQQLHLFLVEQWVP